MDIHGGLADFCQPCLAGHIIVCDIGRAGVDISDVGDCQYVGNQGYDSQQDNG